MVVIGERFPETEVITTHGKIKLPDHFIEKGTWFVLFSHPADFTPVCTTEFYAFQKRYDKFKELNTELIGLSLDQVFSHLKWLDWIKENLGVTVEYPVIADVLGRLSEKLGMLTLDGTHTVRAVFIVDDRGIIRAILYYPPEAGRNIDEILRIIKALQTSDRYGVAIPANWPDNELIGDKVIVPPASSLKKKKEIEEAKNKGEVEAFDWWFSFKKIK